MSNTVDYSTALSDLHESGSRPDSESGGLDRLVIACHAARDLYQELDWEADHITGDAAALIRIAREQTWEVWQRMERAGLPLLQEWQRDNGLLAAPDEAECGACGGRGYDVIGPLHLDCAACNGTGLAPAVCPQCGWDCTDASETPASDEAVPSPARCHACGWQGAAVSSDCPHCGAVSLTGIAAYDGEQVGPLVYNASIAAWVYSAAYDEMALCQRRADSLTRSLGAPFSVAYRGDGWVAVTDAANTPQLRSAMATLTPAAADAVVEF